MRFSEWLQEMALKSYKVGYVSPHTMRRDIKDTINKFNQEDRTAIQNPSLAKYLEKALSKLTKYNFNVILMEEDHKDVIMIGSGLHRNFIQQVSDYIKQNNIQTQGHITFAKNGSTGHPMTPWMILHTIGHAIFEKQYNEVILDDLSSVLDRLIVSGSDWRLYDKIAPFPDESGGAWRGSSRQGFENIIKIFKFKSARTDRKDWKVTGKRELLFELTAEYIWHGGKIRYEMPSNAKFVDSAEGYAFGEENTKRYIGRTIKYLEQQIDQALSNCVGDIIYDYFSE
jgi:hypothetical protein